jgi:hypothetical protein
MPKIAHKHPLEVIWCIRCKKLFELLMKSKKPLQLGELAQHVKITSEATLNHLHALQYYFGIKHLIPKGKRPKWKAQKPTVEPLRFRRGKNNDVKRGMIQPIYIPELIDTTEGLRITNRNESIGWLFMHIRWILERITEYSWWPSPVINKQIKKKKLKLKGWHDTPKVSWYGDIIYFGTKIDNDKFAKKIISLRKIGKDLSCAVVLISTESITHEEYINKVEKELVGDTE